MVENLVNVPFIERDGYIQSSVIVENVFSVQHKCRKETFPKSIKPQLTPGHIRRDILLREIFLGLPM